jgi:hypothetical protein
MPESTGLPAVLQDAAGKKSGKARPAAVNKENEAALKVLSAAAEQAQQRHWAAEQAAAAAKQAAAAEPEAVVVPTSRLEKRPLAALTNRCGLGEANPPGHNARGARHTASLHGGVLQQHNHLHFGSSVDCMHA